MPTDIARLCIPPESTIRQAIASIDSNQMGIVLVVDEKRHLLGTITDGDIRRCILAGQNLDAPVGNILERKPGSPYPRPVTARAGTAATELLAVMQERVIRQLPLLDEQDRLVDLVTITDLLPAQLPDLQAVIMAGGFGTRLRPLTEDLPKPMLPVGDRPVMEHIVRQLRESGIHQVNVTTHYKPEAIVEHFGNGAKFGVDIHYVNEDRPLGTAGALGLMAPWNSTLLVINGDILTGLNFQTMLAFHRENQAWMTVGVRQFDLQVPYGVVDVKGVDVERVSEKPTLNFFVNAGVYLLEPGVNQFITTHEHIDMPDLIMRLVTDKRRVVSFPISEYWLDIGKVDDYEKAKQEYMRKETS